MRRDVPDKAMPELFDVRKCHRVKHALPSPVQSSSDTLFLLGSRKTLNSTDHRTEHFSQWVVRIAASLSKPMSSSSCSPSEDQQSSLSLRGSFFSSVRVLVNEKHRTAKWWLRHAPLTAMCKGIIDLAHIRGSRRGFEAELCSGSPPELSFIYTTAFIIKRLRQY